MPKTIKSVYTYSLISLHFLISISHLKHIKINSVQMIFFSLYIYIYGRKKFVNENHNGSVDPLRSA